MAIVQISRITQRKGLSENLPQLAGAEFGWVIDERRLFIGNGTIQEGAPAIGNTEILTEYSDIFAIAGLYTYKGEAGGYTVQTGPTAGDPVQRTLQSVLDETASVKDFGATGDGDTDDTEAINRALYQMFCRENNPQVRRSLFFPAGIYRVTDSIKIPPYCKLYGEGGDSSVIFLTAADDSAVATYVAQTADSLQQTGVNIGNNGAATPQNVEIYNMGFQSNEEVNLFLIEDAEQISFQDVSFNGPFDQADIANAQGVDSFDTGSLVGGTSYVNATNVATSNSGSGFGLTVNITAAGAVTLVTVNNPGQGYAVGDVITISGGNDNATIEVLSTFNRITTADIASVRFASTVSTITNTVTFDTCHFNGSSYAFDADEQIQGITVQNSRFDTLWQGALIGAGTPVNGGPSGFRLLHNLFDTIYHEGIIIGAVENNMTGFNIFLDVATDFQGGNQTPSTPIIDINGDNNVSLGDMFERDETFNLIEPRIEINNKKVFALDKGERYKFGTYGQDVGKEVYLDLTNTPITVITWLPEQAEAFSMQYKFRDPLNLTTRYGTLQVVSADGDDSSGTATYTDDYSENNPTYLTLDVIQVGNQVEVQYTLPTGSGASGGTLKYSISYLG
jgi:hypothetical protein